MLDLPIVATPDMAECWQSFQVEGEDVQETSMGDSINLDDSLTSLQWLQEFSIVNANVNKSSSSAGASDPHGYNKIPGSAAPCSPLAADPACMGMPHTPGKPISSSTSRTAHLGVGIQAQPMEDIDYKTSPHIKPPYSYATLICMAMQASKKTKITLSAIYKWITDNFCYFRHADPTWQNSIRHNLSLNKCFIKVPREKDEPGKGGFWKIDPQYADRLMNGAIKKRRLPPVQIHPAFASGLGLSSNNVAVVEQNASPWINGGVLNISMESQQLLREFEEATNDQNWNPAEGKAAHKRKQTLPKRVCKAPRLSSSPMLTHEEQTDLGPLKGDFDWEAIFDATLNGSFSTFDDLEMTPPVSPITRAMDLTVHGKHIDCPQEWCPVGQDQVLTESNQNNLDIDETFLATSFLQHPWEEGRNDYLSNSVNLDQLFELNDAFPTVLNEWAPMGSLL
ncbi:forkhead box protein J1 [Rhinatrema bivittatum]|uniref:forkhead box protein J1 n=1 Tax=Rhinatrema bivittatum TaxID=194408 RepID=UPI00112B0476|nr:forkhead box protein J1 [Rhinatrema bivittatum]